MKDLIDAAIREVNQDFRCTEDTFIAPEEWKAFILGKLPEDFDYEGLNIKGKQTNFRACFMTKDITNDNLVNWLTEFETINNVSLKIKTKKKQTAGYVVQNYYRCHHNTRRWSPSKDPQRKLKVNPSARVKNTNCPFQMIVKIDVKGQCYVDVEWEHNHSVDTLEASNFRDLSSECVEKVNKLYESGHTPSTARQQHLKELRATCSDELTYHKKKADRSVTPRKRDFNHLYSKFGEEKFGGKGPLMFEKLEEKLQDYKKSHPGATINHQLYEGDETPLIIAIVSPLMKRVHKEIPQCGELVFVDSTSNAEEHNLKVFMMCTQSVAGALPCGILITSDEKESTLKLGFLLLKSSLPENAFHGRGPDVGPEVILTDNCKEERKALNTVWPSSTLLLCIFHILQQLWRWLHDKSHSISQADRPYILSLFKQALYSESGEIFEDFYSELLNDGRCNRYANLIHYLETLYDGKEAFALCFRAELPVRGNHTNNFAEAQFLVLKDTILRRVKEYNIVGLIDKVTIDLEDHYKDKLLSLADGSLDGQYRQRFLGRGKDGGTGFKVPNQEERDWYLHTVEQFSNNVFTVESLSESDTR